MQQYRLRKETKNGTTYYFPQVGIDVGWFSVKYQWWGITQEGRTTTDPYYKGFDFSSKQSALDLINKHFKYYYPNANTAIEYEYINK